MKDNFRIAIVGAGMISKGAHLPAALALEDVDVCAIVDPEKDRAQQLARDYGLRVKIAAEISEITGSVDGAIIATPNHTHRPIVVQCLEEGISVLVEKPMADTLAAGQEMVDAAARSKAVLAVGYVSRFRPNIKLLHDLLRREYFGDVTRFHHQFGTAGGWSPVSGYHLSKSTGGGGVLTVSGTHFLDRMLMLWGSPASMEYLDDGIAGVEANCEAQFTYHTGKTKLLGSARYSKTTYLPAGLSLQTSAGVVVIPDTDDADITLYPDDAPELAHDIRAVSEGDGEPVDTFELQLMDFVRAARAGAQPEVNGEQGLLSVKLLDELYARKRLFDSNWYSTESRTRKTA
jgi:predicted dehydrogenase